MNRMFLIAGVAALAIAAPASAQGQGQGKGNGGDKRAQSSKVERGGGKARAQNQKANRQQARSGNRQRAQANRQDARSERASQARAERQRNARAERQAERRVDRSRQARADRQRQVAERQREARAQRQAQRRTERAQAARSEQIRDRREASRRNAVERQRDQRRIAERIRDQRQDLRDQRQAVAQLRERNDYRYRDGDRNRYASRGLPAAFVNGCPPGLAKQNELCLPPGQYRKAVGQRLPAGYRGQRLPSGLRDYYRDTDDHYYRYGDGYLYRVDRDRQLVSSVLPLIGAGLGIGMPFPYDSPSYHVPSSYQSFYPDTPYSYHRYANGYVYEIDRDSGLIDDMVPLLDQGYGVGQMLPSSYSYYNVPDPYRSWYRDDDDYLYRYAPGAIYQVDRQTQLITAIVSLLTGSSNGLAVGQPLPAGYDMYNVPYDYRDRYYDTTDSWYRYSNGNIYQVDPTTRLITAVVDAIV